MRRKIRNGLCILIHVSVIVLLIISLIPNKVGMNEKVSVDKLVTDFSYNYIEVEKLVDEEILANNIIEPITDSVKENKSNVVEEKKPLPIIDNGSTVLATYNGKLTAYGPDCRGCSGMTASGYNVWDQTTYDDHEYGEVRIVAADSSIPFYSIVRMVEAGSDPIIAIVLDRGGGIGFNKYVMFDLLFESEAVASTFGLKDNVVFELLRSGN